jgi:hypothetical protein
MVTSPNADQRMRRRLRRETGHVMCMTMYCHCPRASRIASPPARHLNQAKHHSYERIILTIQCRRNECKARGDWRGTIVGERVTDDYFSEDPRPLGAGKVGWAVLRHSLLVQKYHPAVSVSFLYSRSPRGSS